MVSRSKWVVALLWVAAGCAPVGGGSGAARIKAAEGGTVTSKDGFFTLAIPAGAIAADTDFSIRVVPQSEWAPEIAALEPLGDVYAIEPDGTVFEPPATVTWKFATAPERTRGADGAVSLLMGHTRSSDGAIEPSSRTEATYGGESTPDALSVSSEISHLSELVMSLKAEWDWFLPDPPAGTGVVGRGFAELGGGRHAVGETWLPRRLEFVPGENLGSADLVVAASGEGVVTGISDQVPRSVTLAAGQPVGPNPYPSYKCLSVGTGSAHAELTVEFLPQVGDRARLVSKAAFPKESVECVTPSGSEGSATSISIPKTGTSIVNGFSVRDDKVDVTGTAGDAHLTSHDTATGATTQQTLPGQRIETTSQRADGSRLVTGSTVATGKVWYALLSPAGQFLFAQSIETWFGRSRQLAARSNDSFVFTFGNGGVRLAEVSADGLAPNLVTVTPSAATTTAVTPLANGGYAFNVGGVPPGVVAVDQNGSIAWQKLLTSEVFGIRNLLGLSDGGLLLLALYRATGTTQDQGLVMRFDSTGALLWQVLFPTFVGAFAVESPDGFRILGSALSAYAIVALSPTGAFLNARRYADTNGGPLFQTMGIANAKNGGVIWAGIDNSNHVWQVVKTAPDLSIGGCADPAMGTTLTSTDLPAQASTVTPTDASYTLTRTPLTTSPLSLTMASSTPTTGNLCSN